MNAKEVTRLRKNGNLQAAKELAQNLIAAEPYNTWNRSAYSWCLFDELKQLDADKPGAFDQALRIKQAYESEVMPILARPCMEHSLFVSKWIKFAPQDPLFFRWARTEIIPFLREEDYEEQTLPGMDRPMMSLATQIGYALGKYFKHNYEWDYRIPPAQAPLVEEVLGWMEALLKKERKFQQLCYPAAVIAWHLGEVEKSRRLLMQNLKAKPREFWLWEKMALTYPQDSEEALCLRVKAADCPGKPELKVSLLEDLSLALLEKGMHPQAKFFLNASLSIREQNSWNATPRQKSLAAQLESVTARTFSGDEWDKFTAQAEELCGMTPKTIPAETKRVVGRLVWHRGNSFAFVEEIFIPGSLLRSKNLQDGDTVAVLAVKSLNKKKGIMGWSACKILSEVQPQQESANFDQRAPLKMSGEK